jgi:hypothetical protein
MHNPPRAWSGDRQKGLCKMDAIHWLRRLRLSIDLLEGLTTRAVQNAPTEATPEKICEYFASYDADVGTLWKDIDSQRNELLAAGLEVPNEWLTFPVELAWKVSHDPDSDSIAVDGELAKRWAAVYEAIGVQIKRLKFAPRSGGVASLDSEASAEPDGPCGINQWRHNGKILDGEMTSKQYRLASYLFVRIGRKVEIADLIGKDRIFESVADATVQRHGSNISTWFANRDVPLIVESGDGCIWMRKA